MQSSITNQTSTTNQQPIIFSIPAKIISYIFHPLFIPTYLLLFLVYQFPYEFAGITEWQLKLKVFSTFWMTAFFPAFAVFLLYKLKFSNSIYLKTAKERIAPYVITMFFYWWMYYLSRTMQDQPEVLKFFYFGIFIASSLGLTINNFIKISLHGIAMGSVLMAVILIALFYQVNLGFAISITTIITGLVCTCRLLVSNHTNQEIYSGLAVGIVCQLAAYWFAI